MKATDEYALLQPITSLISSLIFVKPEYVIALYALPITSLAENKLVHTDGDAPHSSKHFSNDDNLLPVEADFCVNLDRLFSSAASDFGMHFTLIEQSLFTIVLLQLLGGHSHL